MLVYDITVPKSFDSLDNWREEFLNQASPRDPENFPFIVLGNKKDRENERKVSAAKVEQWTKDKGNVFFYETSAKDNVNVNEAFYNMAQNALS